ncbi:MAG: hypothetical protein ACMVY4_14980 [Minwuia sp.]|uniref:hypothetical protein n=1 Tax=Minwuia sp. TaxID=2493630 RepID=UPI003A87A553
MELLWPGSPVLFLLAWFGWRIAAKAGYSGFWGLTALIPPIGLVALWYLAATKGWPGQTGAGDRGAPKSRDGHDGSGVTIRRPSEVARERSN